VNRIGDKEHWWKSPTAFDFVAKTVCAKCNNGWMSNIEKEAKPSLTPMIEGEAITLDRTAQIAVITVDGVARACVPVHVEASAIHVAGLV
jgi:hypothetical protein